jgi:phosphoribulokinase
MFPVNGQISARMRGRSAEDAPVSIHDSFMSRANSIVIPGAKLDLAMQLILTPFVLQLVERHRRAG